MSSGGPLVKNKREVFDQPEQKRRLASRTDDPVNNDTFL